MIGANANFGEIAQNIDMHFSDFEVTEEKHLFKIHDHTGEHSNETAEVYSGGEIGKGTLLDHDEPKKATFLQQEPEEYIKIDLPREDGDDMHLLLYRTQIFAAGATICTENEHGKVCKEPEQGRHYWGIVADHPSDSIAMCSLQETEYSCVIQLGTDQYTLGNMGDTGSEILFNTKDQKFDLKLNYDDEVIVPELERLQIKASPAFGDNTNAKDKCVKLYIEVEYDIYQSKNSNEQATREWVEAVLAEVFALYANDGVRMTLKSMKIWTTPDNYDRHSQGNKLSQFKNNMSGGFDGDIAHLISFDGGGGIAYLDVLCCKAYAVGCSGLEDSYKKAPTFSWTIEVLAHEIGHQVGMDHTHACVWGPNKNQAIDCCGANAGYNECSATCNAPSEPVDGGTIMSYCHLTGTGINFNHGFGPLPVALMREKVENAQCLSPCELAEDYDQTNSGTGGDSEPVGCTGIEKFERDYMRTSPEGRHLDWIGPFSWTYPLDSVEFTIYNLGEHGSECREKCRVWYYQGEQSGYVGSKTVRDLFEINAGKPHKEMNDWHVVINEPGITGFLIQLLNLDEDVTSCSGEVTLSEITGKCQEQRSIRNDL